MNLFVVNKAWLFSLLWCAGVDSVTTNDCQLLQQMRHPVWLIVRALTLIPPPVRPSLLLHNLPLSSLLVPPYTTFVVGFWPLIGDYSYSHSHLKPT